MNNIELFNFKFVDREIERKLIKKLISASSIDKILWIHGESGVGKTELMKYFTNQSSRTSIFMLIPLKIKQAVTFQFLLKNWKKKIIHYLIIL